MPPADLIRTNLVQLINYARFTLRMSDIEIMQLWHNSFAEAIAITPIKPTDPHPPVGAS